MVVENNRNVTPNKKMAILSVLVTTCFFGPLPALAGPGESVSFGTYYGKDFDSPWIENLIYTQGSA